MAKSKETLQLEKDIWRATYKQVKNDRDMYRDKYRELIFAGSYINVVIVKKKLRLENMLYENQGLWMAYPY